MQPYHKIQTVYKRDPETNHKTLLEGDYSLPEFAYLANNQWVFTEKVDGTNIRVIYDGWGSELRFAGKTENAQIPPALLANLQDTFLHQHDHFVNNFRLGVCLYGEGYGAKIQKGGGNYRPDQGFVLFDVQIYGWWLHRNDVEDIAAKLGIDVAPVVGCGTLHDMVAMARAGMKSTWGDFQSEGLVARPATELRTRDGQRVITKIKCRDFR